MAPNPPVIAKVHDCERGLEAFERLPNPFPRIFISTLIWAVIAVLALRVGLLRWIGITDAFGYADLSRFTFLLYLGLYASWWSVYLSSRFFGESYQVRALRTLLHHTSALWAPARASDPDGDRFDNIRAAHKDKVSVSISTLAMLVSASFFTLTLLLNNFVNVYSPELPKMFGDPNRVAEARWIVFTIGLAGLVGFAAFVCFIVSVDALDSSLNPFYVPRVGGNAGLSETAQADEARRERIDVDLRRYFYSHAINRRYIGLALATSQLFIVTAHVAPLFAALLIAIALGVGYAYWFPSFRYHRVVVRWAAVLFFFLTLPLVGVATFDRWTDAVDVIAVIRPCLAAFMWGGSAQFLYVAIIRHKPQTYIQALGGLWTAITFAILAVAFVALLHPDLLRHQLTFYAVGPSAIGGFLVLTLGTGLYFALQSRGDVSDGAIGLTALKPLLSLVLASTLLWFSRSEAPGMMTFVAISLVAASSIAASYEKWRLLRFTRPFLVGVAVAAAWAFGEVAMAWPLRSLPSRTRMDLVSPEAILITLIGLVAAWVGAGALWMRAGARGRERTPPATGEPDGPRLRWAGFYVLYGIVSFGIAYLLFIDSVWQIGLVYTVILMSGYHAVGYFVVRYYNAVHDDNRANTAEPPADTIWGLFRMIAKWPFFRAMSRVPQWALLMLLGAFCGIAAVLLRQ